jgi:anti-sigma factor ChrR (cupin superfamily)
MNAKKTPRTLKKDLEIMDLSIRHWRLCGKKCNDAELAEQYEIDAVDLTAFRDAVAEGDFDSARNLADAMDTLVRDQIPIRLYHTIFPER